MRFKSFQQPISTNVNFSSDLFACVEFRIFKTLSCSLLSIRAVLHLVEGLHPKRVGEDLRVLTSTLEKRHYLLGCCIMLDHQRKFVSNLGL